MPSSSLHTVHLLCLIIMTVLAPTVSTAGPQCSPRVHFGGRTSTTVSPSSPPPPPTIYEDSIACVKEIVASGGPENSTLTPWNPCTAEVIDVKVSSHIVLPLPTDNFYPFARLNITVNVFDRTAVDTVFLRLECIEAVSGEDTYCNKLPPDHMKQYGRVIWPCRGVRIPVEEKRPFSLSFDCFHLFPNSRYHVNITAFPSGCSSTLTVTIPELIQAYPKGALFYDKSKTKPPLSSYPWSPMLLVDQTASDIGVTLRATVPSGAQWKTIEMMLTEMTGNQNIFRTTFTLENNGTGNQIGVLWENANRGHYLLSAHVPRHDCSSQCQREGGGGAAAGGNMSNSHVTCRPCVSTILPFYLERDYLTPAARIIRDTRDVGKWALPMAVALLAACTIIIALYVRHVRRSAAKRTRDIALVDRPLTLLLYSDDCEPHSNVVREIASLLHSCAHVTYDQEDLLINGSLIPYDWLARSLAAAAKIVVVISPSTPILLKREQQLSSRRPYPDMLQPAFNEISKELCKPVPRVAFVRLSYSPNLPDEFAMLGARCYSLPSDLPRLVSFIHGVQTDGAKDVMMGGSNPHSLIPLNACVDEMIKWMEREGEGWLDQRLQPIDAHQQEAFDTGRIELRGEGTAAIVHNNLPSDLLPPDEEEDHDYDDEGIERGESSLINRIPNGSTKEHVLLPPDSDSDSD